jgi:hypothetical protein
MQAERRRGLLFCSPAEASKSVRGCGVWPAGDRGGARQRREDRPGQDGTAPAATATAASRPRPARQLPQEPSELEPALDSIHSRVQQHLKLQPPLSTLASQQIISARRRPALGSSSSSGATSGPSVAPVPPSPSPSVLPPTCAPARPPSDSLLPSDRQLVATSSRRRRRVRPPLPVEQQEPPSFSKAAPPRRHPETRPEHSTGPLPQPSKAATVLPARSFQGLRQSLPLSPVRYLHRRPRPSRTSSSVRPQILSARLGRPRARAQSQSRPPVRAAREVGRSTRRRTRLRPAQQGSQTESHLLPPPVPPAHLQLLASHSSVGLPGPDRLDPRHPSGSAASLLRISPLD